eukprot:3532673-Rhodomonas_salina.1
MSHPDSITVDRGSETRNASTTVLRDSDSDDHPSPSHRRRPGPHWQALRLNLPVKGVGVQRVPTFES